MTRKLIAMLLTAGTLHGAYAQTTTTMRNFLRTRPCLKN